MGFFFFFLALACFILTNGKSQLSKMDLIAGTHLTGVNIRLFLNLMHLLLLTQVKCVRANTISLTLFHSFDAILIWFAQD